MVDLGIVTGAVAGAVVGWLVRGRVGPGDATTGGSDPAASHVCAGCDATFSRKKSAIRHVMDDHDAVTEGMAAELVREVE